MKLKPLFEIHHSDNSVSRVVFEQLDLETDVDQKGSLDIDSSGCYLYLTPGQTLATVSELVLFNRGYITVTVTCLQRTSSTHQSYDIPAGGLCCLTDVSTSHAVELSCSSTDDQQLDYWVFYR